MKKREFQELFQKCFGKKKDTRYHAITMLAIYGILLLIIMIVVRIGGSSTSNVQENSNPTPSPIVEDDSHQTTNQEKINYSYSYMITDNGKNEIYLGKKVGDKQKFTFIKDNSTVDYAVIKNNYFILENGTYQITENPSKFLKYCDREKIKLLVADEIPTENNHTISYSVSNQVIALFFEEVLEQDFEKTNFIQIHTVNDEVKTIDIDLSNYLSSLEKVDRTLTIHMEFVDIGTTEDFEISL